MSPQTSRLMMMDCEDSQMNTDGGKTGRGEDRDDTMTD